MKFNFIKQWFGKFLLKLVKSNGSFYEIGLGTIAEGIGGHEPKLVARDLEKDLAFIKSCGISTVTIFRLGGLDKDYLGIIDKFAFCA